MNEQTNEKKNQTISQFKFNNKEHSKQRNISFCQLEQNKQIKNKIQFKIRKRKNSKEISNGKEKISIQKTQIYIRRLEKQRELTELWASIDIGGDNRSPPNDWAQYD